MPKALKKPVFRHIICHLITLKNSLCYGILLLVNYCQSRPRSTAAIQDDSDHAQIMRFSAQYTKGEVWE